MSDLLTESEITEGFKTAGLDIRNYTDGERFKAAFSEELEKSIRDSEVNPANLTTAQMKELTSKAMRAAGSRLKTGETTEQMQARLMADAEKVGAGMDPTTLLQIGFSKAKPTVNEDLPKDISGITDPTELLKIAFSNKKGQTK